MRSRPSLRLIVRVVALATIQLASRANAQAPYDVVLRGGRVMDPESGLDAVRDVGIRGDRIAAVAKGPLLGRVIVDVRDLVVAPGFVDLHAHAQDLDGNRWQAQDGVTTALEMEIGAWPIAEWYASRTGRALINYGSTVGHIAARVAVITGASNLRDILREQRAPGRRGDWAYRAATGDELDQLDLNLRRGLAEGGLGIGLGINYTPGARREEIYRVFRLAAEAGVTVHVHTRSAGFQEPGGSMDAIQEVLADAAVSGASLHIVHLGSSGLAQAPMLVRMLDGARQRGLDVTTEVYPYTAGSTLLQSAIFDSGWQEHLGISYKDLQWAATNERLTAETFASYRQVGGWVIIHNIPDSTVDALLVHPRVMIASDGVPIVDGRGHPRGAGTYARVLGRYVREQKKLTLMEALRKMSYLPAERVRTAVPAMGLKGRVKPGADADLTVFDPAHVIDRATFENPARASAGIAFVMVAGTFVVRDGKLVDGVTPGRPVRRVPKPSVR